MAPGLLAAFSIILPLQGSFLLALVSIVASQVLRTFVAFVVRAIAEILGATPSPRIAFCTYTANCHKPVKVHSKGVFIAIEGMWSCKWH